jgi:hypothetical protein
MKTVCNTSFAAYLRTKKTLFFLLFPCLLYWACDDTIDSIGMGIQPPEDKIAVYNTIINIDSAYTVKIDSIYTQTINGLLGNFYDAAYGDIKAGYICQYYPSLGFADSVLNNYIDSVRLKIYYTSYIGDSLAPMELSVYRVNKPLEDNYYTKVDPADYCNLKEAGGRKTYTAWDLNVSDSLLNSTSYYKNITVSLPREWGQELYDKYVSKGRTFGPLEDFVRDFKGTYIESSFGVGNLIQVDISEIQLFYTEFYKTDEGKDTTSVSSSDLTVTKEVIQLNIFENKYSTELLKPDPDKMYLKTPAGVYSKIVIPIPKIVESIGKRKFNSVKLSIGAYAQQTTGNYTLPLPGVIVSSTSKAKLLLIEPDSVKSFFEDQKIADFKTSYTTTYTAATQTYAFDNIANLIQNAIAKAPEKNLEVLLIPVQVEYYSDYTSDTDYSTAHYLFPSAVMLKKGGDNLQLKIIASDLEINNR